MVSSDKCYIVGFGELVNGLEYSATLDTRRSFNSSHTVAVRMYITPTVMALYVVPQASGEKFASYVI